MLDFVTQKQPIIEAWIRQLHTVLCESQDTFKTWTPNGWQDKELPKGRYKEQPNHVRTASGKIHSYAPVLSTPSEMQRFCEELSTEEFINAHPILQSSYAHYAFVAIHPFADGNGRLARALASVFTYRSLSIPLLITHDNKREYLHALEIADEGNYQLFVDFIFERTVDAIRLVDESIKTASLPSLDDSTKSLTKLFYTKGGYSHIDIDQAGYRFYDLFQKELAKQLNEVKKDSNLALSFLGDLSDVQVPSDKFRWTVLNGRRELSIVVSTPMPIEKKRVEVKRRFALSK